MCWNKLLCETIVLKLKLFLLFTNELFIVWILENKLYHGILLTEENL